MIDDGATGAGGHDARQPPCTEGRWEHFSWGSAVGVRGAGPSAAAAFAQAGLAVTAVVTNPARVLPRDEAIVVCAAPRLDDLFFDWIDSVVATMAARRMLFSRFDVRIGDRRLEAHLFGEPLDRQRHAPVVAPKAPTWDGLRVRRDERGWCAECVVDL